MIFLKFAVELPVMLKRPYLPRTRRMRN